MLLFPVKLFTEITRNNFTVRFWNTGSKISRCLNEVVLSYKQQNKNGLCLQHGCWFGEISVIFHFRKYQKRSFLPLINIFFLVLDNSDRGVQNSINSISYLQFLKEWKISIVHSVAIYNLNEIIFPQNSGHFIKFTTALTLINRHMKSITFLNVSTYVSLSRSFKMWQIPEQIKPLLL